MSDNYEYEGKPFTSAIAKGFLNRLYGKKFRIKNAGEIIFERHLNNGGLPPKNNRDLEGEDLLYHIIFTAMRHLKRNGRADRTEQPSIWKVFPEGRRVFGVGSGSVYCFYNPRDRAEAEAQDKTLWPCNIGKTNRDVEKRVGEQTHQWTVEPRIDLIFKTNQPKDLEREIQGILKVFDRQLKNFRGSGREWYNVTPDEVFYLYRSVIPKFK